ncbi:hypothetical protein ABW20_dc0105992 [Dactylellina cionopaga]|nr:hypothetical protein ABW20_dc0105992 [Dactylellina cionopaga]
MAEAIPLEDGHDTETSHVPTSVTSTAIVTPKLPNENENTAQSMAKNKDVLDIVKSPTKLKKKQGRAPPERMIATFRVDCLSPDLVRSLGTLHFLRGQTPADWMDWDTKDLEQGRTSTDTEIEWATGKCSECECDIDPEADLDQKEFGIKAGPADGSCGDAETARFCHEVFGQSLDYANDRHAVHGTAEPYYIEGPGNGLPTWDWLNGLKAAGSGFAGFVADKATSRYPKGRKRPHKRGEIVVYSAVPGAVPESTIDVVPDTTNDENPSTFGDSDKNSKKKSR